MAAPEMAPIAGSVEVAVPADVLWECFRHASLWPRWNACFYWVRNRDLVLGADLVWVFEPIRPRYPYKMPAIARIVEVVPRRRVTWEVTGLPGFFARHTYHVDPVGDDRSRFGSWEQAAGPSFRVLRAFWLAHFAFVRDASLAGARHLETIYQREHELTSRTLSPPGPAA
jgi:hypothetical protein